MVKQRGRDGGSVRRRSFAAILVRMGIRQWFTKIRKSENEGAVERARDEIRAGSPEEREGISGDIEHLGAANLAERAPGESSIRDSGRFRGL